MNRLMKWINSTLIAITLCTPVLAATFRPNDSIRDTQQKILAAINDYRFEHGLEKLKMNSFISEAAADHSLEMAENKIPFGHQGFQNRMTTLFNHFQASRGFAENVAFTYANATTVVQQWLDSPGHRKNIEGNFNLTGIGIVYDKYGRVYVTQIFLLNKS